jgi:hypothetical protein
MAAPVEPDEAQAPVSIELLGARTVVPASDRKPKLVHESNTVHGGSPGRGTGATNQLQPVGADLSLSRMQLIDIATTPGIERGLRIFLYEFNLSTYS